MGDNACFQDRIVLPLHLHLQSYVTLDTLVVGAATNGKEDGRTLATQTTKRYAWSFGTPKPQAKIISILVTTGEEMDQVSKAGQIGSTGQDNKI
jgi:hypothetical protein